MSSPDTDAIPLPIRILLEQEKDEKCSVFLDYEPYTTSDNYTKGKLVSVSELTSAEYTITDKFQIPTENIKELSPDIDASTNARIMLSGCTETDLETLFNRVRIAYTIGTETAEVE